MSGTPSNILEIQKLIWPAINETGKDITLYTYAEDPKNARPIVIKPGDRIIFPKQVQFLQALEKYDAILYGGAVGSGKSHVLRWALIWLLLKWALPKEQGGYGLRNVKVGLFCETYTALEDRQISKLKELPETLGTWNDKAKEFRLHERLGGGIIKCRNLDEYWKYASVEFAAIAIDELTHNPEATYNFLRTRRRYPPIEHCPIIAATNPGAIGHCVPEGEVLTPDRGWTDIRLMRVGDPIYTVLKDGTLAPSHVDQVHSSHYRGEMVDVNASNLQMICTPNHKVAKQLGVRMGKNTREKTSDLFSLVPFEDLPGQAFIMRRVKYDAPPLPAFQLKEIRKGARQRTPKHKQPLEISGRDFCELLGWFLSEGYCVERDAAFGIAQMKAGGREKITALLDRCGFTYSTSSKAFTIYSRTWFEYFKQFGKCRDKFIPQWVKNGSRDDLMVLIGALMGGDGHWYEDGAAGRYYTTSKQLADDVAEIAVKVGGTVRLYERHRDNRYGASYEVAMGWHCDSAFSELQTGHHKYKVKTTTKRRSKIKRVDYDGPVYCVGVPDTHTFLVRQRGSVWVSGNSWVFEKFVNPRKRVRPHYDEKLDYQSKGNAFIQALPSDNPLLPKQYLADLNALPEKQRRALVDGDWTVFAGQYFSMLDPNIHLIAPFEVPESWNRFRAIDFGSAHPTVCLWGATNEQGDLYVYREYSMGGEYATYNKRRIAELSVDRNGKPETYRLTVGDPSMWWNEHSSEANKIPAEVFNDSNDGIGSFYMQKANNARIQGWQALADGFSYELEGGRYDLDERGRPRIAFVRKPRIYVFSNCDYTWESLTNVLHDEAKVEDVKKTSKAIYGPGKGDDEAETLRYLNLAARPSASLIIEPSKDMGIVPPWKQKHHRLNPLATAYARF